MGVNGYYGKKPFMFAVNPQFLTCVRSEAERVAEARQISGMYSNVKQIEDNRKLSCRLYKMKWIMGKIREKKFAKGEDDWRIELWKMIPRKERYRYQKPDSCPCSCVECKPGKRYRKVNRPSSPKSSDRFLPAAATC